MSPAAAGLLGMRLGAKADPDGYTLLAVNDSVVSVFAEHAQGTPGMIPARISSPLSRWCGCTGR